MIGKIITYMRKKSKLSQEEISKLTNYTKSTISGYETGYRQPKFKDIEKIANICGYEIIFKNRNTNEEISSKNIERKMI